MLNTNPDITEHLPNEVHASTSRVDSWKYPTDYLFRLRYFAGKKRPLDEYTLGRTSYSRYSTPANLPNNEIDCVISLTNRLAPCQWKIALNADKADINQEIVALLNTVGKVNLGVNKSVLRNSVISISNLSISRKAFEKQYDARLVCIEETRKEHVWS